VLRRLRAAGALADWQVAKLKSWRHSGFSIDAGEAPLAADDAAGRRRLAEYLLRAPFSLDKITYNADSGSVLYRSERTGAPSATSKSSPPLSSSPHCWPRSRPRASRKSATTAGTAIAAAVCASKTPPAPAGRLTLRPPGPDAAAAPGAN